MKHHHHHHHHHRRARPLTPAVLLPARLLALLLALLLAGVVAAACGGDATAPATGRLAIAVSGLPAGVEPLVIVTGPNGYRVQAGALDTLTALREGTYTVVAADITDGDVRYAATPATQTVAVPAGGLGVAGGIAYAIATARLTVTVDGLPAGVPANVTVRGPGGSSLVLDATTTASLLAPGDYTIVAGAVAAAGKTYRPDPETQGVTLTASATPAAVAVHYGGGTGVLDLTVAGLPAGIDAAVSVTGPGGAARTLTSSARLIHLEAGRYTVTATTVGSDLTTHRPAAERQSVDVAEGVTSAATVSYGSEELRLALRLVAEGLTEPVFLTAPDGDPRLFVAERNGRIRIIENGVLRATPFLDIRDRVNFVGERGLLSFAFDPRYAANGYFYVFYVDLNGDVVVERYASTPGSSVAGSSAGLVLGVTHRGSEHHGGQIAFGPDGMLYVGIGDGGCCGDPHDNAQNRSTLLGKLLRVDVRTPPYAVPRDNPFIGRGDEPSPVWAYGLRNPWRFSFDDRAGTLYIGDVGQDAREEVDVAPASAAGLNYGWRLMEGSACYNPSTNCGAPPSLTPPAVEYSHADGCSVIGGYVYRGAAIPELMGHYLYADYCRGWLRSFRWAGGVATEPRTWAGVSAPRTVSFGRDRAGELYLIGAGRVWLLVRQ